MKNLICLVAILFTLIFLTGCNEDKDDNPQPVPSEHYSVTYSLNAFGGIGDLQISYFAPREIRRVKSNPKTPWSESLTEYWLLDSVALNVEMIPLANKTVNYEWEVRISKGGELLDLNSGSESISTGENPQPIYIDWRQIIE